MSKYLKTHLSLLPFFITVLAALVWVLFFYEGSLDRLFVTADQQGQGYYDKKEYMKAGESFENSLLKGAAYFKAGAFKKAKAVYQNLSSKEGKYNLGNACVMLGEYDAAIEAYEIALKIDPDFQAAKENLVIAKARKILKEPENDGEEGVGALGADEIVFDNKEGKGVDDDSSATEATESGNPNWLDRLQTGPKEFLRNKFSYQYQMQERSHVK